MACFPSVVGKDGWAIKWSTYPDLATAMAKEEGNGEGLVFRGDLDYFLENGLMWVDEWELKGDTPYGRSLREKKWYPWLLR
jgi:hypothetical protein